MHSPDKKNIMFWHSVLSIFCTLVASSSAFVSPVGRVVPKSSPVQFVHISTKTNAARSLTVAGRIPWGKFLLDCQQRIQLVSIVRKETHVLDITLVSCCNL